MYPMDTPYLPLVKMRANERILSSALNFVLESSDAVLMNRSSRGHNIGPLIIMIPNPNRACINSASKMTFGRVHP